MAGFLKEKNPRLLVPGSALVLALLLLLSGVFGPGEEDHIPTAKVARQSFQVRVSTVGTLDAAQSTVICSQVKGDKGKIIFLAEEGTRVNAGDVLVRLDPTYFEEQVMKYEGEVGEVEASVEAWKQAVEWEKSQGEKEIKVAEYEERIKRLNARRARLAAEVLEYLHGRMLELTGVAAAALHDPCAVLAVTHPGLFEFAARPLAVALEDPLTRGMTVVDERYAGRKAPHQVDVAYRIDAEQSFEILLEALAADPD